MKYLDFTVGLVIASELCVQPLPVYSFAGGGAGGGHGGFASVGASPGRAAVAPTLSSGTGSMGNGRRMGEGFPGRFRHDRDFGTWGYGWYPYGYSYSDTNQQAQAATEEEQLAEEERYDKNVAEQDRRRARLPASAFVRNYYWPASSMNQPAGTRRQSVAASKSTPKPM